MENSAHLTGTSNQQYTKHTDLSDAATSAIATRNYTHTHPFNGPLSGTTRVSQYQKGKTNLDFTEARDSEWQWHQLGHMQVCTVLPTDTTPAHHHSVFYRPDALPATQPTASKHWRQKLTTTVAVKARSSSSSNRWVAVTITRCDVITSRKRSSVSNSLSDTNFLRWVIVVCVEHLTHTNTQILPDHTQPFAAGLHRKLVTSKSWL